MAVIVGLSGWSIEVLKDVARYIGSCEVDVVGCDDWV